MGQDIEPRVFTHEDRTQFRRKLRRCMQAYTQMIAESTFASADPSTGFEIELNLVDAHADPALRNVDVLEAIDDEAFQTELAQYNIEVNVSPRQLRDGALKDFEDDVRARLNSADARARELGVRLVMVGILPTVTAGHMSLATLSPKARYKLLNDQIIHARGEDIHIALDGVEELTMTTDTVAPESACTSTQLHLEVSQESFPAYWNAAQAIAGPQVAVSANSPFLFGKELWRETRIKLFEQAIDTRSVELAEQGVRPRVWFGERWLTSVTELFDENMRYFTPLLPVSDDEDPIERTRGGRGPRAFRTPTAQRHHLPVEPAGLRHRARPAAPADRKPRAARWTERGGRARQRGSVLRAGSPARRVRSACVVTDVVRCGQRELRPRRTERYRRRAVLARIGLAQRR